MNCTRESKVVAVLAALMSLVALAEPRAWVGDATTHCGSWGAPGNWSPEGCPQEGDDVTIPDYGCDMTIEISGTQKTRQFYVDYRTDYTSASVAADKVTFTGDGSLVCTTSGSDTHNIRNKRHVVVNGPDITLGGQVTYVNGTLEVTGGSTVGTVDKNLLLWTPESQLIVDNGTVNVGYSLTFGSNSNPASILLKSGSITVPVWLNDDSMPYNLTIEGGLMSIANFKLKNAKSSLTMTGGRLQIGYPSDANIVSDLLHVTGGRVVYGNSATQDIRLTNPKLVNIPGADVEVVGRFVFTNGLSVAGGEAFFVNTLKTGDSANPARLERGTVVFNDQQPFDMSLNQRKFEIEGPTVFRGRADMPRSGANVYVYCYGPLTLDTRDWTDPSVTRKLFFKGISSGAGSLELTVTGGGSAAVVPVYTYNSCKSVVVAAGTTLELAPRGNSAEWGHMNAESLTLGPNATLAFEAGKNFMQASRWNVDSTAKIAVDASSFTEGAVALLLDSDGDDIPADVVARVEVTGQPEGSVIVNERGQLTLRKDYAASEIGKWGDLEWTGAGANKLIKTDDNWYGHVAPAEKTALYAGAATQSSIAYSGFTQGGTLGSLTFAENSTRTFNLSLDSGTLTVAAYGGASEYSKIISKSSVPQVISAYIRNYGEFGFWGSDAPLIYDTYQFNNNGDGVMNMRGDARVKSTYWRTLQMAQLKLTAYEYPASATRFTLQKDPADKGDTTFLVTKQTTSLSDVVGAGFRVCEGAKLTFDGSSGARLQWINDSQCNIIDGTLDVLAPFYGCGNQFYGGRGTVWATNEQVVTTYSAGRNSRVYFQDALDVNLADWRTATLNRDADLAIALGARGTPVFHVKDGWTYGPETGVETATTADLRAFRVEKGAVATIDPDGGEVFFKDIVTGSGTLAIAGGTLALAPASANTARIAVDADSTLEVSGATEVGAVAGEAGATIHLADGACLIASGVCELNGVKIVPVGNFTGAWLTWLVVKDGGSLSGTPVLPQGVKVRTKEVDGGVAYQIREGGLSIILR